MTSITHTQKPESALLSTSAGSGLALELPDDDARAHSSYQQSNMSMNDSEDLPCSPTSPIPFLSSVSFARNDATRQISLNQDEEPPPASHLTPVSYPSNKISTSKYTLLTFIPKNLYEQFRYVSLLFSIIYIMLTHCSCFAWR